jgi:hypothetical protein
MITYFRLFRQAIPENKDKNLKTPKLPDIQIFPLLVNRTVLFFLVMCLISLFLYVIGTVQGFMDDTQLFLLRLGLGMSILLSLSSLYGLVLDLVLFFREKKARFICGAGIYAFLVFFGGIIAASAGFIIGASGGNIQ